MSNGNIRLRREWSTRPVPLGAIVAVALVAWGVVGCGSREAPPPAPQDPFFLFLYPGIRQPPVVPAAEAKLADDEEVIGLTVEGHARAYRLQAFCDRTTHIVNDLVGDVPVSVTYCDTGRCVQAFTGASRGTPLDISQGGQMMKSQEMVIRAGGHGYRQHTLAFEPQAGMAANPPAFPYATHPFTLTKWKDWLEAHPDTDVYLGVANVMNP